MIAAARWRKRQRGGSAMLLILVQIQAGPPAFAASASYGSASQPSGPRTQSGPALLVSPPRGRPAAPKLEERSPAPPATARQARQAVPERNPAQPSLSPPRGRPAAPKLEAP